MKRVVSILSIALSLSFFVLPIHELKPGDFVYLSQLYDKLSNWKATNDLQLIRNASALYVLAFCLTLSAIKIKKTYRQNIATIIAILAQAFYPAYTLSSSFINKFPVTITTVGTALIVLLIIHFWIMSLYLDCFYIKMKTQKQKEDTR